MRIMPDAFAQETQNLPYQKLTVPVPPDTVGKVEVLEFFSYSCWHCAAMEPMVEKWAKMLPKRVVFKSVPVAFSAAMKPLQQLYYTLKVLHRPDLHAKVFAAIHLENKPIFDRELIREWVIAQGVDAVKFDEVFDSFSVQADVERANQLTQAYQIDGTPSYAVRGKYVTSPAIAGNSYQGVLDEVNKLIRLAR